MERIWSHILYMILEDKEDFFSTYDIYRIVLDDYYSLDIVFCIFHKF